MTKILPPCYRHAGNPSLASNHVQNMCETRASSAKGRGVESRQNVQGGSGSAECRLQKEGSGGPHPEDAESRESESAHLALLENLHTICDQAEQQR